MTNPFAIVFPQRPSTGDEEYSYIAFVELCARIKHHAVFAEQSFKTLVKLVHTSSSTMSYDFLNLRPITHPIMTDLAQAVVDVFSPAEKAFMGSYVAFQDLVGCLSRYQSGTTDSIPFQIVTISNLAIARDALRSSVEHIPRAQNTLQTAHLQLTEALSFPTGVNSALRYVIPAVLLPGYTNRRVETLGHLSPLLQSITISLDALYNALHIFISFYLPLFESLTAQRTEEKKDDSEFCRSLCDIAFPLEQAQEALIKLARVDIIQEVTNSMHSSW
ncbi:hypothetical protein FISHEDRAFT_74127 [Fistulina hepatica ATCC 64428]|uniref:Uncharacterized protein n=1 Tax=Fistulina hepatica ATCC 64428 TaxID=1128425 RepID=A0A0D7ADL5_9AGAR|nr:hypothetical protein FISHEDRAFT_74127 [Fistulina hepatica ATCC 64428]